MQMQSRIRAAMIAILAAAAFTSQAVVAVEATDTTADVSSGGLEEVVVTAQRRSESKLDVPMSVAVLSSEELARAGVNETSDLGKLAPGLTISFYAANMSSTLRGITGTGGNLHSTSSVPIYLDGVYQPSMISSLMSLPDVERIEVLKGPQGTLYGQGATGGAIIVNTLAPSFTSTGKFSTSFGNYDAMNLRGFVSAPLSDNLAFSVAADYVERDGFRKNFVTGQRNVGLDSKTLRGKLLFRPSDSVDIILNGYYSDYRDSSAVSYFALNDSSAGYALVPTAPKHPSSDQYGSDPDSYIDSEAYGGGVKVDIDLDAGNLSVLASYFRTTVEGLYDLDASPVNFNLYRAIDWPSRHYVGAVDFASEKIGRFSYNVGAFYLDTVNTTNGGAYQLFASGTTVLPAVPGEPTFVSNNYTRQEKQIGAVYFDAQYDVTDRLHVSAGGRYNKEWLRAFQSAFPTVDPPAPIVLNEYPGGRVSFSEFSPRATIRYEVTPTSNAYASVSRGFKGGGFNVTNYALPPFKPETITAYEVGFKGRPSDALGVSLAAFWYDYKDMQVLSYDTSGQTPATIEKNAAASRSKGVELEANLQVSPQLTLSGAVSYLDAEFVKFPGAQVYSPSDTGTGNVSHTNVDLSGVRMLRSPEWSGNVSADYEVDTQVGTFGAFALLAFSSSYGLDPGNLVRSGSYERLDGELSFAPAGIDGLRLVAWVKNLTDTKYLTLASVSTLASAVSYSDPRTFGVRAEFSF